MDVVSDYQQRPCLSGHGEPDIAGPFPSRSLFSDLKPASDYIYNDTPSLVVVDIPKRR